jgi:hypothetical protein
MNPDSHQSFDLTDLDCSSDRPDSLAADSSGSIDFNLRLAADPTTAPSLLKKLADTDDRRIRETIAGNPNAPTELLLKLGAEFPKQLLNNPVLPLLCLEDLNQVDNIPRETLCSLLKQPNVPEFVFELGVKTENWEAIGSLGMNPQTPKAILERLVQTTENPEFQQVAKLHVNWDGEIAEGGEAIARQELETLFEEYDSSFFKPLKRLYAIAQIGPESLPDSVIEQQAIADDPETPRCLLESLSCSEHFEIRLAVAVNPSTPSEILTQLAQEQQDWIQQAIAENPNTPPEVLTQLATDSEQSVAVLEAIALHPETPLPILEHLVSSKYPRVTQAAIQNLYWATNLDPQWKTLYHNRLASNSPDLPSHLSQKLENMAVHRDPEIRIKLATHPKTPPQILSQLAHDPDIEVRLALVNNPRTPVTIFGEFIYPEGAEQSSKGDRIQMEIARNTNTPSRLLRRLATHSDPRIRQEVAANPHTPPQCLVDLAQDKSGYLWLTIYKCPHTPFKALEVCLHTICEELEEQHERSQPYSWRYSPENLIKMFLEIARRYLARFPEGLSRVLEYCLRPTVPAIFRLLAFSYPKIRATAFKNYTPSAIWIERYCITQHPNTPTSLLERLAQDGNRIVRAAAKARLQGHPGQNLHSWIMR